MARPLKFDRDEAVQVALDTLWRDGYRPQSVKGLSEKLGITRSSFYNTFKSRDGLMVEALESYVEIAPDRILRDAPFAEPVKSITTRFLWQVCIFLTDDELPDGCFVMNTLCANAHCDDHAAHWVRDLVRENMSAMTARFEHAIKRGELDDVIPAKELALAIANIALGLSTMSRVVTDPDQLFLGVKHNLVGLGLFDPQALIAH